MKHIGLTSILLAAALAFALEGTCGIGLRRLFEPLVAFERTVALSDGEISDSEELPFTIVLKSARTEYYGTETERTDSATVTGKGTELPKQFTSIIQIDGTDYATSVNHPCRYGKWRIYQYDFDSETGLSVLKVIGRSPAGWAAVLLLLTTATVFLAGELKHIGWCGAVAAVILAAGFTVAAIAGFSLKALPPSLRSPFFLPHIMLYMLAYALLSISLFTRRTAGAASALLLTGLLIGSIWAKMVWGHFWQWDVKECWAAATWCISAASLLQKKEGSRLCYLLLSVLAFAAMNMTWYGVNWLPGAASSLHTY